MKHANTIKQLEENWMPANIANWAFGPYFLFQLLVVIAIWGFYYFYDKNYHEVTTIGMLDLFLGPIANFFSTTEMWFLFVIETLLFVAWTICVGHWANRSVRILNGRNIRLKYDTGPSILFMFLIPIYQWFAPNHVFRQISQGYDDIRSHTASQESLPWRYPFGINAFWIPLQVVSLILRYMSRVSPSDNADYDTITGWFSLILVWHGIFLGLTLLVWSYIFFLTRSESALGGILQRDQAAAVRPVVVSEALAPEPSPELTETSPDAPTP